MGQRHLAITLASPQSSAVKVGSVAVVDYHDSSLFVGQYDGRLTISVAPCLVLKAARQLDTR